MIQIKTMMFTIKFLHVPECLALNGLKVSEKNNRMVQIVHGTNGQ